MAVRLIIEDLEGATTIVPLANEEVTIGRKDHNTIQLNEQNVSRSHARLQFRDDGWIIQDLGSYNGVKINGVPIAEQTLLRESDLIQIGDYHLTLTDDVAKATLDSERSRGAANDANANAGASSAELPSVSVEDLEPIRPATGAPLSYDSPEEDGAGNKTGLIVAGVVALIAVIGIGGWIATRGGDGDTGEEVTTRDSGKDSDQADTAAAHGPAADTDEAGPGDDAEQIEEVPEEGVVSDDGTLEMDDGLPEAADGGVELVEDVGGAGKNTGPGNTTTKKKTTKKKKPKPKPKPSVDPSLTADQALAQARKAMVAGNNRSAYNLAKQAYDGGKGAEALSLMGVTACKMGSGSKAKSAYRKLSGSKKEMLEKVCGPLGISLN